MERVATFSKVSLKRWCEDWTGTFGDGRYEGRALIGEVSQEAAERIYGKLRLPERATAGSAGYDIYTPFDMVLEPGESIMIPTGIRCRMREDCVLLIFPRSSLGFKYRFGLRNTVGVIDSDYYHSDNEGHIFVQMINANDDGLKMSLHAGQAFAQGIFLNYGITEDDACMGIRNGGIGSTDA